MAVFDGENLIALEIKFSSIKNKSMWSVLNKKSIALIGPIRMISFFQQQLYIYLSNPQSVLQAQYVP